MHAIVACSHYKTELVFCNQCVCQMAITFHSVMSCCDNMVKLVRVQVVIQICFLKLVIVLDTCRVSSEIL